MIASRKALIVVAAFLLMALGLPLGGRSPDGLRADPGDRGRPAVRRAGRAEPDRGHQGQGFKNGAKAKFYKTGTTDPAGVNVKSTQYVSSTQLIANIDIADTAALAQFDIQVAEH